MEQWGLYTRSLVHHPTSFQQSFDPVEEENKENFYYEDPLPPQYSIPIKDSYMAEVPMVDNTENEVTQFLREIKKEKWISKFLENDITDLQTLRELKPDEWKLLELPIGARNAIEREVKDRMVTVAPDSPQKIRSTIKLYNPGKEIPGVFQARRTAIKPKIMIAGEPATGKSTFINTAVIEINDSLYSERTISAGTHKSQTYHYEEVALTDNIVICDIRGISIDEVMEHAKNVLWGAYNNKTLMDGYAFPSRVKSLVATLTDIPHCLIFTASSKNYRRSFGELTAKVQTPIRKLLNYVYQSEVPYIVLITMMDEATEPRSQIVNWLTHNIPNINKNLIFCVTNYDDRTTYHMHKTPENQREILGAIFEALVLSDKFIAEKEGGLIKRFGRGCLDLIHNA